MIRRKKPWAVATAATLLLGLAGSAMGFGSRLGSVSKARFGEAEDAADQIQKLEGDLKAKYAAAVGNNKTLRDSGLKLVSSLDSREQWLEVYQAIESCLPRPTGTRRDIIDIEKIDRISIRAITTQKFDDLGQWVTEPSFTETAKLYLREDKDAGKLAEEKAKEAAGEGAAPGAAAPVAPPVVEKKSDLPPEYEINDKSVPPKGAGYVFYLYGVHYHNEEISREKRKELGLTTEDVHQSKSVGYVDSQFVRNLQKWMQVQESESGGESIKTPVRLIGITHATIMDFTDDVIEYDPERKTFVGMSAAQPIAPGAYPGPGGAFGGAFGGTMGRMGRNRHGDEDDAPAVPRLGTGTMPTPTTPRPNTLSDPNMKKVTRTSFRVAFAWSPIPIAERKAWPPPVQATPASPAAPEADKPAS